MPSTIPALTNKPVPSASDMYIIADGLGNNFQVTQAQLAAIFGSGSGAPTIAEYVLGIANGSLPNGRIPTNTATVNWDVSVANQLKANVPNLSGTNTGDQTVTLTGGVTGSGTGSFAATVITNANLTGEVTSAGNAATVVNSAVIGKVITGYVSGAGTVAATDTILQAIQKLNGNDATNANLTGPVTSVGNATAIANGAISNAMLANGAVANLSGVNTGDQTLVGLGGVPTTRLINTTSPLAGGGDLTADRTLTIAQANTGTNGFLSSTDWNTFNNKGSGTVTSVGGTAPLTSSGGATPVISTSMNTARLIGRGTIGVGVMEEITIGANLLLTGTTLSATAGGGGVWTAITATVATPALWAAITISVPGTLSTNKVALVWANTVDADINDMAQECTVVKANAGTDVIVLTLSSIDKSFLFGQYKFLYQVSV